MKITRESLAIEHCGPDACFVMTDDDAALMTRVDLPGITRPSGDPRYRDLGPGSAAGWTPQQQDAALKLAKLWRAALPLRGFPMGYGDAGRAQGASLGPEAAAAAQEAWDGYSAAMGEVERQCSMAHANALRMAVVHEEPSSLGRAYLVREALSFLVDLWGVK